MLWWACWVLLCGYGLVDSRLTVTVYGGDMCSSSNHKLSLETGAAYVAPSVGIILASASLRDVHLQRQALEYIFYSVQWWLWQISFPALVSLVLFWPPSPDAISICRCTPLLFVFFLHQSLSLSPAPELCAPLLSPPEPQCNIHDAVESSQRRVGDTQKDVESLLLPL